MIFMGIFLILCGGLLLSFYFIKVYPEQSARKLLVQGITLYERGDKDSVNKALDVLTELVAKYEQTNTARSGYYYMGLCYENLGLNKLASEKYNFIFQNYQDLPLKTKHELQIKLSRMKILRQQTEEGVDQLLALINNSSDRKFRSRIYTELGHAYLQLRKYEKADRMFEIALNEDGNNQDAILGKALTFRSMGYHNKAYDMYERYLKFHGYFNTYTKNLRKKFLAQVANSGYRSFKKGEYSNSIAYYNRLLRNFPENAKTEEAFYWIGHSYLALGKYNTAITYFNKVLANGYSYLNQNTKSPSCGGS